MRIARTAMEILGPGFKKIDSKYSVKRRNQKSSSGKVDYVFLGALEGDLDNAFVFRTSDASELSLLVGDIRRLKGKLKDGFNLNVRKSGSTFTYEVPSGRFVDMVPLGKNIIPLSPSGGETIYQILAPFQRGRSQRVYRPRMGQCSGFRDDSLVEDSINSSED